MLDKLLNKNKSILDKLDKSEITILENAISDKIKVI